MTRDEIIEVLIIERTCVERQDTPSCDRDCLKCDLALPRDRVVTAYEQAIDQLHKVGKYRKKAKRWKRKYLEALSQQPCDDAISREMALKECHDIVVDGERYRVIQEETLLGLPSVTQKPKTGHWVEENINEWSRKVFCSECGCPPPFEYVSTGDVYSASGYGVSNKTKFCPNCGCRMVEPQESEDKE